MKKIILVVLALLVAAGAALYLNLGDVVKTAIETAGTQAVGTPVRVSGLSVSLADKLASLNGLSVSNPGGFNEKIALKAKSISVTVGDVSQQVVVLKEIVVDGLAVTYELGASGSNLDVLQKNLKSATASGSGESAKGASGGSEKKTPDVVIQQLRIINAQIIPSIAGKSEPVSLPDIVLNNIGSKSNPATPKQVATEVLNKIVAAASSVALKSGLAAPLAAVTGQAGAVAGKATSGLKGLFSK